MKNFIICKSISYIKKYNNYSNKKIEEIKYGLEAIYLTISKMIIISIIALLFNIFKEMIIFMFIYNVLRTVAFGLHATKSWICLLSSSIIFLGIPYMCLIIYIPVFIKCLICILGIVFMYKNSPADTYKRPIVSKKRRNTYKFLSVVITIIYSFISILITNSFLSNCFIFSIVLENLLISPLVYKIFGLPYNNYINYIKLHPELSI